MRPHMRLLALIAGALALSALVPPVVVVVVIPAPDLPGVAVEVAATRRARRRGPLIRL